MTDRLGQPAAGGPPRVDVLGVTISCLTLDAAVEEVAGWVDRGEHRYVCVTGVHGVMESQRDRDLLRIHNRSGLNSGDDPVQITCPPMMFVVAGLVPDVQRQEQATSNTQRKA